MMEAMKKLIEMLRNGDWEPWEMYRDNVLKDLDPDGIDPDSGFTNLERARAEWEMAYSRMLDDLEKFIKREEGIKDDLSRYGY